MKTAFIALFSALPLAAFAGGPLITATGSCPGAFDVSGMGFTPGGAYRFVYSDAGPGSDPLPRGRCAGVATGLSGPRFAYGNTASPSGGFDFAPSIPEGACGTQFRDGGTGRCGA